MHRFRSALLLFVALGVAAASCDDSGNGIKAIGPPADLTTTTTTATTTTTTTTIDPDATTVTTFPSAFASPLNGLPATNTLQLDRRAIAVKVDNHPQARPQSGIETADAMLETIVEGGLTRFIALFHDDDAERVGPIRSLRPTDSALVAPINAPLAISGGQAWIQAIAVRRDVRLIGETQGFFRLGSRRAPHNLYATTDAIRATADRRNLSNDPPPGLFQIGEWPIPAEPATEITMDWSDAGRVRWVWEDGVYTRWNGTSPHMWVDAQSETGQVTAGVLIVISGRQYTERNPAGSGSNVPAIETVGSGDAWIFAVGRVWRGTWQRASANDPFTVFELDGTPAVVPTGIPWISVFPEQRSITYE